MCLKQPELVPLIANVPFLLAPLVPRQPTPDLWIRIVHKVYNLSLYFSTWPPFGKNFLWRKRRSCNRDLPHPVVALLLDFVLTKHKKLNLEQQPCEEDPDYSFSHCARESLSQKVTKWRNIVINCTLCGQILSTGRLSTAWGQVESTRQECLRSKPPVQV